MLIKISSVDDILPSLEALSELGISYKTNDDNSITIELILFTPFNILSDRMVCKPPPTWLLKSSSGLYSNLLRFPVFIYKSIPSFGLGIIGHVSSIYL